MCNRFTAEIIGMSALFLFFKVASAHLPGYHVQVSECIGPDAESFASAISTFSFTVTYCTC